MSRTIRDVFEDMKALAEEAQAIVEHEYPNAVSWCEAYDVYNNIQSWNRYDNTMEDLVEQIESGEFDDDEEADDE